MRRGWRDALISTGALMLLLIGLVSIDDRVRHYFTHFVWTAASPSGAASVGAQLRDATSVLFVAARDQSIDHAPLMLFILAATVLVLFMVRT